MGVSSVAKNHTHHYPNSQAFNISIDVSPPSKCFDDDGRLKRTGLMNIPQGIVWTTSAHIITTVIGSGVLSLVWATAQGWVAAMRINQNDSLCKRNYTYMDAVHSNLGGLNVKICGLVQYMNLVGVAVGYTIASSISIMAIKRSNCFHEKGEHNPCHANRNPYMMAFGITEIIFSQIPDFDQLGWLFIVAAVMSFTYSLIGLGFGIAKVAENGGFKGSLTGISIGVVTPTHKLWRSFQALGDIAFAYSFSLILIEIQDMIRSPPAESKTMKKASLISTAVTTLFYMLYGCMGYAAFGETGKIEE